MRQSEGKAAIGLNDLLRGVVNRLRWVEACSYRGRFVNNGV